MTTLYTWAGNQQGQAIQVAAALANMNISVENVVPGSKIDGFPEYASAPVLSSGASKLTQFGSILAHVSGNSSADLFEWVGFAQNVIAPNASAWVYPTLGAMPNNKGAIKEGKDNLLSSLNDLNNILSTKTFLVGERPSAADAAVVSALSLAFKQVLSPEYRKKMPHVERWFNTCINQSAFSAFGKITLASKEAAFDGKTFGALNKKGAGDAKPQQKKQEKKKEKPAPTPAPVVKKERKDPWAGLAGNIDMDDWKRFYSNNTEKDSIDYFWKIFDKENYSCWIGKYMYNDELKLTFMASNLVGGMHQRLEKMKKHAFASHIVFKKDDGSLEIASVWFWKGQDLHFKLCEDWQVDYEVYDWKKLDTDNQQDRDLIGKYWSWEGFEGKTAEDGKIFK